MDVAAFLAEVPLFAGLSADERADIAAISGTRSLAAGELVFDEGEPGSDMYLVASEAVHIDKRADDGAPMSLVTLGAPRVDFSAARRRQEGGTLLGELTEMSPSGRRFTCAA